MLPAALESALLRPIPSLDWLTLASHFGNRDGGGGGGGFGGGGGGLWGGGGGGGVGGGGGGGGGGVISGKAKSQKQSHR